LHGEGKDINADTAYPVSNSIYCLGVAGRIANRMDTDFSVPDDIGFSFYISFPLNFGPWGNKFYQELTASIQCGTWYNIWNAEQC
jgi:hypothetical protein